MNVEMIQFLVDLYLYLVFAGLFGGAAIIFSSFYHRNVLVLTIGFVLTMTSIAMINPITPAFGESTSQWLRLLCVIAMMITSCVYVCRCTEMMKKQKKQKKASKPSEAATADASV